MSGPHTYPELLEPADGHLPEYDGGELTLPMFIEVFKSAMHAVSIALPGRTTLLSQSALALLIRHHQLLVSRAGTGKSFYGDCLFGQFTATVFKAQFTQGTRLETVLGGLDLNLFHEGKLWHNTRHSLVTAEFAYLDEFMNASDVVLEALLGILNERHFSQGEQQEDAQLHTALAMTNHVKYTMIAEPILDRFMFKASIEPYSDPLNDLLIDFSYESHHGRPVVPEHPIPIRHLTQATNAIRGMDPETRIHASNAMLYLKNFLIDSYVDSLTRHNQAAAMPRSGPTGNPVGDVYVSPRTKAASRDVLNASALLHHRKSVTTEDLAALRFVLTTVDGNDAAPQRATDRLFAEAMQTTLNTFSSDDLQVIEELSAIAQNFQLFIHGSHVESQAEHSSIMRIVLTLIGRTNWQEVNHNTFLQALQGKKIANPRVNALREEILQSVRSFSHAV